MLAYIIKKSHITYLERTRIFRDIFYFNITLFLLLYWGKIPNAHLQKYMKINNLEYFIFSDDLNIKKILRKDFLIFKKVIFRRK